VINTDAIAQAVDGVLTFHRKRKRCGGGREITHKTRLRAALAPKQISSTLVQRMEFHGGISVSMLARAPSRLAFALDNTWTMRVHHVLDTTCQEQTLALFDQVAALGDHSPSPQLEDRALLALQQGFFKILSNTDTLCALITNIAST
jgi:hypothetical protein